MPKVSKKPRDYPAPQEWPAPILSPEERAALPPDRDRDFPDLDNLPVAPAL